MSLHVRTEGFEGPFDLLVQMIARQRLDIRTVSLAQITDAYVEELRHLQSLDLDVASEFLVLAATLLELKAAALLPAPAQRMAGVLDALLEEQDVAFMRRLQALAYRSVAMELANRLVAGACWRGHAPAAVEVRSEQARPLEGVDPSTLARLAAAAFAPPRVPTAHLPPPLPPLSDVMAMTARTVAQRGTSTLHDIAGAQAPVPEVVAVFLAILELYRQGHIDVEQAAPFLELIVRALPGLLAADVVLSMDPVFGQEDSLSISR